MAMPAGPELLVEAYKNSLLAKEWAQENPNEFLNGLDDYMIQHVFLEDYYRRNKVLIDGIVEDMGIDTTPLLNEGMLTDLVTDLGIGFGTKIPWIGKAVAVGGFLYYAARAITAADKGEKMTTFFEAFSAVGVAAATIPAVGSAVSAIVSGVMAAVKKIFMFIVPGGKFVKPLLSVAKYLKGGSGIADDVAKQQAALIKKTLDSGGGKAVTTAVKKLGGTLDTIIKWITSPTAAKVIDKIPGGNKLVGIFETFSGTLNSLGKLSDNILAASGDDVLESIAKSSDEIAEVAGAAGNDALKAEMAALKAEKAAVDQAASGVEKASKKASKDISKARKAQGTAKKAAKAVKETEEAVLKSMDELGETAGRKLNQSVSDAVKNIDDVVSDEIIEAAGKNIKKGINTKTIKKALFPNSSRTSRMRQQVIKSLKGNPDEIKRLKNMSLDEFADDFAKKFVGKNADSMSLQGLSYVGGGSTGSFSYVIKGANGAVANLTPNNLVNMLGKDEAAKILSRTFGGGMREALEATVRETAEAVTKSKATKEVLENRLKELTGKSFQIQKLMDDLAEKIIKESDEIIEEVIEETGKVAGKEIAGKSSEEITKGLSVKFADLIVARVGSYVSRAVEMDDIEAFQATYGTAEDARMTSAQRATAQGLNEIKAHMIEMYDLQKLKFKVDNHNKLLKNAKIIRLIS